MGLKFMGSRDPHGYFRYRSRHRMINIVTMMKYSDIANNCRVCVCVCVCVCGGGGGGGGKVNNWSHVVNSQKII